MSMVSGQPLQPGLQEEEPVSLAPLSLESDPSGFENQFVERAYARWTDVLGGLARIALDADSELAPEELSPATYSFGRSLRYSIIRDTAPEAAPGFKPAPEPAGRSPPRPWSVP